MNIDMRGGNTAEDRARDRERERCLIRVGFRPTLGAQELTQTHSIRADIATAYVSKHARKRAARRSLDPYRLQHGDRGMNMYHPDQSTRVKKADEEAKKNTVGDTKKSDQPVRQCVYQEKQFLCLYPKRKRRRQTKTTKSVEGVSAVSKGGMREKKKCRQKGAQKSLRTFSVNLERETKRGRKKSCKGNARNGANGKQGKGCNRCVFKRPRTYLLPST